MYAFFEVEIVSLKGVFLVEGGGAMPPGPLLFLFDTGVGKYEQNLQH